MGEALGEAVGSRGFAPESPSVKAQRRGARITGGVGIKLGYRAA